MNLLALSALLLATQPDVNEIIHRSSEATRQDWKNAPAYSFMERDVETKGGQKTIRANRVLMIEGSPYYRLIAANDKPLSPQQDAEEQRKLEQEIVRRQHETENERARRIAKYEKERQQNHAMLEEMVNAFEFRFAGEEEMNGRQVFVIDAEPRPGYQPKSRNTRMLTGMRGRLWIDKHAYQWVKVEAEVTRPVSFAVFLAKVSPGTRFVLEQAPVTRDLWLPKHFAVQVNSSILWRSRRSATDETYRDYRRAIRP